MVPPAQAETNNARIRNQTAPRLMTRVCHEHRDCHQWWLPVEHLDSGVFAVRVTPCGIRGLMGLGGEASPVKWGRLHSVHGLDDGVMASKDTPGQLRLLPFIAFAPTLRSFSPALVEATTPASLLPAFISKSGRSRSLAHLIAWGV